MHFWYRCTLRRSCRHCYERVYHMFIILPPFSFSCGRVILVHSKILTWFGHCYIINKLQMEEHDTDFSSYHTLYRVEIIRTVWRHKVLARLVSVCRYRSLMCHGKQRPWDHLSLCFLIKVLVPLGHCGLIDNLPKWVEDPITSSVPPKPKSLVTLQCRYTIIHERAHANGITSWCLYVRGISSMGTVWHLSRFVFEL